MWTSRDSSRSSPAVAASSSSSSFFSSSSSSSASLSCSSFSIDIRSFPSSGPRQSVARTPSIIDERSSEDDVVDIISDPTRPRRRSRHSEHRQTLRRRTQLRRLLLPSDARLFIDEPFLKKSTSVSRWTKRRRSSGSSIRHSRNPRRADRPTGRRGSSSSGSFGRRNPSSTERSKFHPADDRLRRRSSAAKSSLPITIPSTPSSTSDARTFSTLSSTFFDVVIAEAPVSSASFNLLTYSPPISSNVPTSSFHSSAPSIPSVSSSTPLSSSSSSSAYDEVTGRNHRRCNDVTTPPSSVIIVIPPSPSSSSSSSSTTARESTETEAAIETSRLSTTINAIATTSYMMASTSPSSSLTLSSALSSSTTSSPTSGFQRPRTEYSLGNRRRRRQRQRRSLPSGGDVGAGRSASVGVKYGVARNSSSSSLGVGGLIGVFLAAMLCACSVSPTGAETCNSARNRCMSNNGCAMALHNYMTLCSDLIYGSSNRCSDLCKKALLSLASTDYGQSLINCNCTRDNPFCAEQRERMEVCKHVLEHLPTVLDNGSRVSCTLAEWICTADSTCLVALEYYQRNCVQLFDGAECTMFCNNSINILKRQEKSKKLWSCECDGTEDYDCPGLKSNLNTLCYPQPVTPPVVYPPVSTKAPTKTPPKKGDDKKPTPSSAAPTVSRSKQPFFYFFLSSSSSSMLLPWILLLWLLIFLGPDFSHDFVGASSAVAKVIDEEGVVGRKKEVSERRRRKMTERREAEEEDVVDEDDDDPAMEVATTMTRKMMMTSTTTKTRRETRASGPEPDSRRLDASRLSSSPSSSPTTIPRLSPPFPSPATLSSGMDEVDSRPFQSAQSDQRPSRLNFYRSASSTSTTTTTRTTTTTTTTVIATLTKPTKTAPEAADAAIKNATFASFPPRQSFLFQILLLNVYHTLSLGFLIPQRIVWSFPSSSSSSLSSSCSCRRRCLFRRCCSHPVDHCSLLPLLPTPRCFSPNLIFNFSLSSLFDRHTPQCCHC